MRTKLLIIGIILMLALVGCTQGTNSQRLQSISPQNQYVGGGCGVSGIDNYGDVKELPMWGEL